MLSKVKLSTAEKPSPPYGSGLRRIEREFDELMGNKHLPGRNTLEQKDIHGIIAKNVFNVTYTRTKHRNKRFQ